MKSEAVRGFLEISTGHKIDTQALIYWEKEGLLGEVIRINDDRRDYSSQNIDRLVLTLVLRNAGWKIPDIKKVFDKNDTYVSMANQTLDRMKGLPSAIERARSVIC